MRKSSKKRLVILLSIGIVVIVGGTYWINSFFTCRALKKDKAFFNLKPMEYPYERLKRMVEYNCLRSSLYWGIKYLKRPRTPEEHFKYAFRIGDDILSYISCPYPKIRKSGPSRSIKFPPEEVEELRASQVRENEKWQRKIDRAIKSLREIIDNHPESRWADDALFHIPVLYLLKGDYDKEIEANREIVRRYNQYRTEDFEEWTIQHSSMLRFLSHLNLVALAQTNIANTYCRYKKDYKQAIIEYNKVIDNYPQDIQAFSASRYIEKYCCPALGDYRPAFKAYQKIIDNHPQTKNAYLAQYFMARCYKKQKKYAQAVDAFQKLISSYPENKWHSAAQYEIGSLYEKQKKYPRAIQAYQKVIDNYPKKKHLVRNSKKRIQELKSKGE